MFSAICKFFADKSYAVKVISHCKLLVVSLRLFTAGTLFDMKECEAVYEKSAVGEKEKYYRHYFKQMNGKKEVFKPGPALGLYIALHKLKGKIPEDFIKLRFGITTRFDTIHCFLRQFPPDI